MIQLLFPLHVIVFVEYKWDIKRAYRITGVNDIVSWIYCFGKGDGYIEVSCKFMKMLSLPNVMEKIINDSITLYLFNILKLLCLIFSTFILLSYINVCI